MTLSARVLPVILFRSCLTVLSIVIFHILTQKMIFSPNYLRSFTPLAFAVFTPLSLSSASSFTAVSPRLCPRHLIQPISNTCPVNNIHMTVSINASSAEQPNATAAITGPKWDLEYADLDTPQLLADIATAERLTEAINIAGDNMKHLLTSVRKLTVDQARESGALSRVIDMTKDYWAAVILLRNVATQAGCEASCDGSNAAAKKMSSAMQVKFATLRKAYEPAALFLDLCDDTVFDTVLESGDDELRAAEYSMRHSRKMRDHKLSLDEENVITTMSVTGHSAWGSLYTDLSATIPVTVRLPDGEKTMGIASADAMRDDRDPAVRCASWEAIREAWLPHRETCAAALNAITGWRADMYARREYPSFLSSSLHQNRMSNNTLKALLSAIDEDGVFVGRKALRVQATALGQKNLHPWDLFAPAPVIQASERLYTFEEGIELIADAVSEVDEEAGAFVRMMKENKWIEASRGDKKRPGAYCTGFAKSRTPRVYLSDYNGGAALLLTLAHELGHAFHSWVMRDLPVAQLSYPMNLAETASIFFETVVGNRLVADASSAEERFGMLWGEAESAGAFLLNIPARYRFEHELNERRAASGPLSVDEIDDAMVRAWKHYYGECLKQEDLERVGVFSQSKLHFYLTGISFYNWPYSFGYLFALGVYARYEESIAEVGAQNTPKFSQVYRALLRDTGRMDAEDVVMKHLGARIDEPKFWKDAIAVAGRKVEQLHDAAVEIGKS